MARSKPPIKQSTYDEELASSILERIAKGETLKAICRELGEPAESTFRNWVINDREGLSARYEQARHLQAESWADQIVDIVDETQYDDKETANGTIANSEWISRSRLRFEARKWLMAKLHPKVYGEKIESTLVGKDGGPVNIGLIEVIRGKDK